MIELFKSKEQKESVITNYQNPFKTESVQKIEFTIENSYFNGKTAYKSLVRFQSGDTSGYHRIESEDFPSLLDKTEIFIKSL